MQAENSEDLESFYIFDERMSTFHSLHPNLEDPSKTYNCPEVPARTKNIHTYLEKAGLLKHMRELKLGELSSEVIDFLEQEILPMSHSKEYVQSLKDKCNILKDLETLPDRINDVYFSNDSYKGGLLSLLAAIRGVQAILDNSKVKRGYCITRPPGHHAKCSDAAGFCLFNNVGMAAKWAKKQGRRVCIFDWDIHHGDGTQEEFYEDDEVLFISMHRCDNMSFYPYDKEMAP